VIVAPAGSLTGSIGVFALRPTFKGLLDKLDIQVERMTRGARSDLLLASEPLSEQSAQLMQEAVDDVYRLFIDRVAAGRGMERADVEALAQGRVWTGEQAFERGMIDGIGGLLEAERQAKRAIGLDPNADVALIAYPPPGSLVDQLSQAFQGSVQEWVPSTSLPAVAEVVQDWIESASLGAPALVPPFVLDIR
jgi:protease-4